MINDELWEKLEMFVGTNLLNLAIPHFVNELQERLTPKQLEPLGDLDEMLTKLFSEKSDISAKKRIDFYVDLAQKGVIKKKR